MTNEVATIDRPRREVIQDAVPILDSAKFDQMQRIATAMAHGSLVPEALTHIGSGDNKVELPYERIVANCFLVVNQAVRWGLDPFAVAQCVSVVHGKLCYEGKLVAGVLEAKLNTRLVYEWNDKTGDAYGIKVSGKTTDGRVEFVEGTVGDWKTTGSGSPWGKASNHRRMLAYRGTREWARLFAPGLMLGVYSDDEMYDLVEDARARRARPVDGPGLAARLQAPRGEGFSKDHVTRELGGDVVDATTGEINSAAGTENRGGAPATSAANPNDGGADEVANQSSSHNSTETAGSEVGTGQAGAKPATESQSAKSAEPAQAGLEEEKSEREGAPSPADTSSPAARVADKPAPSGQAPVQSGGVGSAGAQGRSDGGSAPSGSAPDFHSYHLACMRATQEKSLRTLDTQFRNAHAWCTEEAHMEKLREIFRAHLKRCKKELTAEDFQAEIKKVCA